MQNVTKDIPHRIFLDESPQQPFMRQNWDGFRLRKNG